MKWYKHDPDAFIAGTAELTFEECGAYICLIDLLYSRDGNVPDDDAFCARVFHCRPQVWRRLKAALIEKGKIHETSGKLTANRVEKELQTAGKRIEIMRGLRQIQLQNQRNGSAAAPGHPQPQPHPDKKVSIDFAANAATPIKESAKEEKKAKRSSAKLPIPPDWKPDEQDREYARSKGMADWEIAVEGEKFRDHALANDRRCADWHAAWRNWINSPYRKPNQEVNGHGRGRSVLEAIERVIDHEAAARYVPGSEGPGSAKLDCGTGQPHRGIVSQR